MTSPSSLYEVSWEVANKVGGIHTVIASKARTAVERLGDDYVLFGPWLRGEQIAEPPIEDLAGYEDYREACRADGVPVRVGRWRIPGRPLTVLVAFSELYGQKDGVLAGLWERHRVDSLTGAWDYVEPVLFGQAAAIAIRHWYARSWHGPDHATVAQFHEWLTGSGLLYLHDFEPGIGTVFTTHATVLGRALAAAGMELEATLGVRSKEALAEELGVRAKHSLESAVVAAADVFTTVSAITAREAALIHERQADVLLPNGIDLEVIAEQASAVSRSEAKRRLRAVAEAMLGQDLAAEAMIGLSGRYEFHNKGIDVFIDALAKLESQGGPPLVAWVFCPTDNSGLQRALMDRLAQPELPREGALGLVTHNLFDPAADPVQQRALSRGLDNRPERRVKLIQVPIYLGSGDGLFDLPYEAVLQGLDLTCFPSFYEPWGYTPLESLAVGVPTVTSDRAGFGQWCLEQGLGPQDGVTILPRSTVDEEGAAELLAQAIDAILAQPPSGEHVAARCRAAAARTSWSIQFAHYEQAYHRAVEVQRSRTEERPRPTFAAVAAVPLAPTAERHRPNLQTFEVRAPLPSALEGLSRLAANYWWTWDGEAPQLFEALSPERWEACGHNPTRLLLEVSAEDLRRAARDRAYVSRLRAALARFEAYMAGSQNGSVAGRPLTPDRPVAYFCAEFGLHESLPIYSGGLGVLAGDHLKSASDLGLPLVAVGLFYWQGYVAQRLTANGEQLSADVTIRPEDHALQRVLQPDGKPLELQIGTPDGQVKVAAWRADVGRVPLYLLDTQLADNRPEDREILRHLYGGGPETRLRQEIVLGKAGERLLQALGIRPAVYHLNEGHAALVALERVSRLVHEEGLTFEEARELVRSTTVFTTHTPVPAGHDRFGEDIMRRYFSDVTLWLGLSWERFFALGQCREDPSCFNMTGLALNFAGFVNAVSESHRRVAQELLQPFWPSLLTNEVPVEGITNGVHLASWTSPEMRSALGVPVGPVRGEHYAASAISDEQLWQVRCACRRRMIDEVARRLSQRSAERHDNPRLLGRMLDGLTPDALFIGFARRFAPYKRANLLFTRPEQLARLLSRDEAPVRVVIAGLAHPNDELGKSLLRQVFELSRSEPFVGKVFFVEGHDIGLARVLVQGCDVWLNTPVHGLEASGTSGMKAAANGGLNLSVLDGWWAEGYEPGHGWAIGGRRVYEDQELQDELDAAELYRLLDDVVVPQFFSRDAQRLPREWLQAVRQSLMRFPTFFNTDRMLGEYARLAYEPLAAALPALSADRFAALRRRVERLEVVRKAFSAVHVQRAEILRPDTTVANARLAAVASVALGDLTPDDVIVEMVVGPARDDHSLAEVTIVPLRPVSGPHDGVWTFRGVHVPAATGRYAYGIRVRPRHGALADPQLSDLVTWA